MTDGKPDSAAGRPDGRASIARLIAAIGYPERMSDASAVFTLRVDGAEIAAEELDGRLVLSCALTEDETHLPKLATYAAGRMLREDAVLAYGDRKVLLWQDAPADSDARGLLRFFESFADSCEWWRARVEEFDSSERMDDVMRMDV